MGGGRIAYFAHLGGFATGIGLAVLLLKLKLVEMNPRYEESIFDVFKIRGAKKDVKVIYSDPNYRWLQNDLARWFSEAREPDLDHQGSE